MSPPHHAPQGAGVPGEGVGDLPFLAVIFGRLLSEREGIEGGHDVGLIFGRLLSEREGIEAGYAVGLIFGCLLSPHPGQVSLAKVFEAVTAAKASLGIRSASILASSGRRDWSHSPSPRSSGRHPCRQPDAGHQAASARPRQAPPPSIRPCRAPRVCCWTSLLLGIACLLLDAAFGVEHRHVGPFRVTVKPPPIP